MVEFLYQQGGWLSVLFGNDERQLCGHYAVLHYVLSMEQGTKCWITVRVEAMPISWNSHPLRRVPAAVWVSAKMTHVRFNPGRLAARAPSGAAGRLADELYPLRKDSMDYRQRPAPTTDAGNLRFINELGDKKNNGCRLARCMSPDEPGHFRLFVDGENIIDADYRLFYVHRGMENWRNPHGLTKSPSCRIACGNRGFRPR